MEAKIIFEDRHILIIDKPAGVPCVNVSGGKTDTLAKWIIDNYPKQKKLKTNPGEAGLINRLDNDTSGIVIAAKTDKAFERLKKIWRGKEVLKEYECLVLGQTHPEGKITKLIAHHPDKSNKMIVVDDAVEAKRLKARYAETEYRLIEGFLDYSHLKIKITGGVRHQIRCHLSSIGHPISGDKLYQRAKHESRDWLNPGHHLLHASKVGFTHPTSGKYVEFVSALPYDLQRSLEKLKKA